MLRASKKGSIVSVDLSVHIHKQKVTKQSWPPRELQGLIIQPVSDDLHYLFVLYVYYHVFMIMFLKKITNHMLVILHKQKVYIVSILLQC